jgi:ribA/ribD-fused uncharacterized protein
MIQDIKGFQGEYRWLSNFWRSPIDFSGMTFVSTENAYQAAKVRTSEANKKKAFQLINPSDAKKLGRSTHIRPDWVYIRLAVMLSLQRKKFSNPNLRRLLLATGDAYIEETNSWHDTFWGVCNGVGENNLGKIIMLVRDELREPK